MQSRQELRLGGLGVGLQVEGVRPRQRNQGSPSDTEQERGDRRGDTPEDLSCGSLHFVHRRRVLPDQLFRQLPTAVELHGGGGADDTSRRDVKRPVLGHLAEVSTLEREEWGVLAGALAEEIDSLPVGLAQPGGEGFDGLCDEGHDKRLLNCDDLNCSRTT